MIRTFVAVDLPHSLHVQLGQLSSRLQRTGAAVSWVKPDRIHLTLKFLGNIPPEKIDAIRTALQSVASATAAFRLRPSGCGAFPTMKQIRVVWVGLEGDLDALRFLQERVEAAIAPLGFDPENRPFKPHLTLGRVKGKKNLHALQETLLEEQGFQLEAFDVMEVVLYKSDLRPEGARYTPLFRAQFSPR